MKSEPAMTATAVVPSVVTRRVGVAWIRAFVMRVIGPCRIVSRWMMMTAMPCVVASWVGVTCVMSRWVRVGRERSNRRYRVSGVMVCPCVVASWVGVAWIRSSWVRSCRVMSSWVGVSSPWVWSG